MTKPHTTLSEAVRALELPTPSWARDHHGENEVYTAQDLRNIREAAAKLVEQHEAQEPFGPIVAYASSSEFRRNQLLSKAQYDNCLPKNRVDFDIPLVAVSKCDMCNDNGSVGFPPDDYYPCPKCTPPTLAATQAGDAWQPIETAPKDGTRFLASYDGEVDFFHWQEVPNFPDSPVGWRNSFITVYKEHEGPTHWMPLPSAPPTTRSE